MLLPAMPSSRIKGFAADNSEALVVQRLKDPISSLELALGLWCQSVGILRADYNHLHSILIMANRRSQDISSLL
jgi:hypothetical protein